MTKNEPMKHHEARNGYTGKSLTNGQFDEAWANAEIMCRSIKKSGSFIEKLTDYSHAFSRSEKFDQSKAEIIIRDIFEDRYGQPMNEMREELLTRQNNLPDTSRSEALQQARRIEPMIRDGETMPFYRAYDAAACTLVDQLGITENGAKELMKSVYKEVEGHDLYETCKAVEKAHHEPVKQASREAAKQERAADRYQARSRARA